MELIPTHDGEIAACLEGCGPPILFLHGGPGDTHDYMKRMAKPLFSKFTCVFFDQRGTGRSSVNVRCPKNFSLPLLFEDVLAVKEHYGLNRPSIVGHSWGAIYALFFCLQYPEHFQKLALLNMGPLNLDFENQTAENLKKVFTHEELQEWDQLRFNRNFARDHGNLKLVQSLDKKLMELRVKSWIYNPNLRAPFLIEYFQDPLPDREVNKWIWENSRDWFRWEKLRDCFVPTWLCVGENDSVPLSQAEKIETEMPNAKVTVLSECGHIPWLEHPGIFYSNLVKFLDEEAILESSKKIF